MDKCTIMGIRRTAFDTKDGKEVRGTSLYFSYPGKDMLGVMCDKAFVPDRIQLPELKPGMNVMLLYNKYGKVEAVSPVA